MALLARLLDVLAGGLIDQEIITLGAGPNRSGDPPGLSAPARPCVAFLVAVLDGNFSTFIGLAPRLRPVPGTPCSIPRRESWSSKSRPRDDKCRTRQLKPFDAGRRRGLEHLSIGRSS